jgi:hypothetical protein
LSSQEEEEGKAFHGVSLEEEEWSQTPKRRKSFIDRTCRSGIASSVKRFKGELSEDGNSDLELEEHQGGDKKFPIKQPSSASEDELLLEDDDEEWMDAPGRSSPSGGNVLTASRLVRVLLGNLVHCRKKAPSGSACEKHKRWKKRCPDDCPLRKSKRRSSPKEHFLCHNDSFEFPKDGASQENTKLRWTKDQMEQVMSVSVCH